MGWHLLAVDRCFPRNRRADAMTYARWRLAEIEGRIMHLVEVEAAVVKCPSDHGWERAQPVEVVGETA